MGGLTERKGAAERSELKYQISLHQKSRNFILLIINYARDDSVHLISRQFYDL